jgi:hypothetical protein
MPENFVFTFPVHKSLFDYRTFTIPKKEVRLWTLLERKFRGVVSKSQERSIVQVNFLHEDYEGYTKIHAHVSRRTIRVHFGSDLRDALVENGLDVGDVITVGYDGQTGFSLETEPQFGEIQKFAGLRGPGELSKIFVEPPPPRKRKGGKAPSLTKGVQQAQKDAANRKLGEAGERFVLQLERLRLKAANRPHLARKVIWSSRKSGDGLGFDIRSFDDDGKPIYIEVKTTNGSIGTPFFITSNELWVAQKRKASFRLYRLFDFGGNRRVFSLEGPLENKLALKPLLFRAQVGKRDDARHSAGSFVTEKRRNARQRDSR